VPTANSKVQSIDLLDRTRGWGYVQYTLNAPAKGTTATQTAGLTGPAANSTMATITVKG